MYLCLQKAWVEFQNYFCPYSTILSYIFLTWIVILETGRCWTRPPKYNCNIWELAIWYSKIFTLILDFFGGRLAFISFSLLLHKKKETQGGMRGEQWDYNIISIIYYSWVNAIKKLVQSLEFRNGFTSTILSASFVCFLGTFIWLN